jgi:hypothetical protein
VGAANLQKYNVHRSLGSAGITVWTNAAKVWRSRVNYQTSFAGDGLEWKTSISPRLCKQTRNGFFQKCSVTCGGSNSGSFVSPSFFPIGSGRFKVANAVLAVLRCPQRPQF